MNVLLVKVTTTGYSMKPADLDNCVSLMIGVASLRSVKNTCAKRGYTIVGTLDRTGSK